MRKALRDRSSHAAFIMIAMAAVSSVSLALAQENQTQKEESIIVGGALKFGIELTGEHELSVYGMSVTDDVETGMSFAAEVFGAPTPNFDLGAGVAFQLPRDLETSDAEFQFIPIYGMIRIKVESKDVAPYLTGQLGYNAIEANNVYKGSGAFEAELSGGLYWGVGAGVIVKEHFLLEALYSINSASAEHGDIEYRKVGVNLGVHF